MPISLMDILRDHGLDDPDLPPSVAAWHGLLLAIESPEDEPGLAEYHLGFDLIGAALQDPLMLIDANGGLQRWNGAAEPIVGDCEAGGQVPFGSAVVDHDGGQHLDLIADFDDAIRDNQPPMEGFVDGLIGLNDRGPFAYRIIPIGVERAIGAIIRFADRTEVRHAEERAQRAHDEVGDVERTRAQFVTNTSHELRTPLNGIIGMASLLEDTDLNSEQHEFVEIIKTSGEALLSLVNDILDFSKFEAGRFDLEIIDYELDRMVHDLADMLATKAHEAGIDLVIDLPPDVPTDLIGDPGRVRQVLTNLISNALKFTSAGEVVVSVRVAAADKPKPKLRFEVIDSGLGIAPHAIDRLFLPFQQADSSTTREYGGTGLGLAICKQIVEMMDGTIGVESTLNVGSTFWFELPLHQQPTVRSGREPTTAEDLKTMSGKRVLVIDSSPTRRRVLATQLRSWGAEVVCGDTGEEAETLSRQADSEGRAFDVVLMDAVMAMDEERAPTPRARSGRRVVMNSRLVRELEMFESVETEVSIRKPVRPKQLLEAIRKVESGVYDAPDSHSDAPDAPDAPPTVEAFTHQLLIAEDNVVNQKVAAQMMKRMGYATEVVNNGRQAVDALANREFDAVLMDCQMPVMSGYEASEAIRASELGTGRRVPIIALTAHAMPGDRQRCLDAGMDDYVTKPLDAAILAEVLDRWLAHEASRQTEASSVPTVPFAPSSDALDESAVEKLRSLEDPSSPGFVAEIYNDFLEALAGHLTKLRDAVQANDAEALRAAAHTFKGSAANVGAERLRLEAMALEEIAKSGALMDDTETLDSLERMMSEARAAIEALPEMATRPE